MSPSLIDGHSTICSPWSWSTVSMNDSAAQPSRSTHITTLIGLTHHTPTYSPSAELRPTHSSSTTVPLSSAVLPYPTILPKLLSSNSPKLDPTLTFSKQEHHRHNLQRPHSPNAKPRRMGLGQFRRILLGWSVFSLCRKSSQVNSSPFLYVYLSSPRSSCN